MRSDCYMGHKYGITEGLGKKLLNPRGFSNEKF
jgi:hypothetical protein